MVADRRIILERRIARLENAIRNANRQQMRRKFESADNFEPELRKLVERGLVGKSGFIVSSNWVNNGAEINIQDDMGDEEYYDDWDSDYATYRVTLDDGMYNVTYSGNFSDPNLGTFSTLRAAARAIVEDRG